MKEQHSVYTKCSYTVHTYLTLKIGWYMCGDSTSYTLHQNNISIFPRSVIVYIISGIAPGDGTL